MSRADWRRLRRFERKKEKGLIIEKPCNVGDPVWYIEDDRIVPSKVDVMMWTQSTIMDTPLFEIAGEGFSVLDEDFGRRVFLSEEKAREWLRAVECIGE